MVEWTDDSKTVLDWIFKIHYIVCDTEDHN